MKHKTLHNGSKCPLPEGFEVKVYYRNRCDRSDSSYTNLRWNYTGREADIIGYEILGLADGYAYPWEEQS